MSLPVLFIVITIVSAFLGGYRLFTGPTGTDRVLGLDILFSVAVVLCLQAAWSSGSSAYLDVAIGLALTGFVATLAWARLISKADAGDTP